MPHAPAPALIRASLLLGLLPAAALAAAPDLKAGETLHAKYCVACHVRNFGGDGSTIYTRPEHAMKSLTALQQRVSFCSTQINAKLFPEDEAAIAAYLNQKYYKFK